MTASFPLEVIDLWNLVHSYFVLNSQKSRDDVNNALVLPSATMYITYLLWQYGLWSFQTEGTKLARFLPKNQPTQRKLLNFENWIKLMGVSEVFKNQSFKNQLFSSTHSPN